MHMNNIRKGELISVDLDILLANIKKELIGF